MAYLDLLGIVAGILTTVSFVPQVLKIWSARSAKDISFGMFLLFAVGVALWLVYGVLIQATPIIVANVVTLALVIVIIAMKLRFG